MKLQKIKRATWEKELYPDAKWIVVERKYNTYDACASLSDAIRYWFWHLGSLPRGPLDLGGRRNESTKG